MGGSGGCLAICSDYNSRHFLYLADEITQKKGTVQIFVYDKWDSPIKKDYVCGAMKTYQC